MKNQLEKLEHHYKSWIHFLGSMPSNILVENCAEDIYILTPANYSSDSKKLKLCITVTIHGNEVAGVAILSQFLELVKNKIIHLTFPIGIAIGNISAALNGYRYNQKDLNRSFGSDSTELFEQRRAKELEKFLFDDCDFLLDIHQTRLANTTPFTIFPYTAKSLAFAALVCPGQPAITHWGPNFSKEGMCSDEYVQLKGGEGITVETGAAGFDPYQIGFGLQTILKALEVLNSRALEKKMDKKSLSNILNSTSTPIYSWAQVIEFPEDTSISLKEGLINFTSIDKGDALGLKDNKTFYSEQDGAVLFPIYPCTKTGKYIKPPREIVRLVKEISIEDLPFKS